MNYITQSHNDKQGGREKPTKQASKQTEKQLPHWISSVLKGVRN